VTELVVDWCDYKAAKWAVEHWHYSHSMPAGKTVKCGVWEDSKFIGVVVFSRGATNAIGNPYGLKNTECCELTRIALNNHQASVTKIVSIAIRLLKIRNVGLRLIVSFADPEQGHLGAIYQAGNWMYLGMTNSADEYLIHGKRLHGRSMRSLYGTHIGKDWIQKIKGSSKHRYLYPLDKAMRRQIEPLAQPYPKREPAGD
jgi:hypothetical protein